MDIAALQCLHVSQELACPFMQYSFVDIAIGDGKALTLIAFLAEYKAIDVLVADFVIRYTQRSHTTGFEIYYPAIP